MYVPSTFSAYPAWLEFILPALCELYRLRPFMPLSRQSFPPPARFSFSPPNQQLGHRPPSTLPLLISYHAPPFPSLILSSFHLSLALLFYSERSPTTCRIADH